MVKKKGFHSKCVADMYGDNVFNLKTMKNYLLKETYLTLRKTIEERDALNPKIADEVADAMKAWAISKGAIYFSHWFQPLSGVTAEKHDSFLIPDEEGGVIFKFSGKELIRGEPDASSFPSGGLRTTFEACGYTVWDPTSPAFIKEGKRGATLCIPSVFYSYHGEALDKKTGLLRSIGALAKQICRLSGLFGIDEKRNPVRVMMGFEQEYFLVDKEYYYRRLDLLQTGRTLFGNVPAKHQQMSDHYFGVIKSRVMDFMEALDYDLWRLGVPIKTRHNEVCPAQYELAIIYEELNRAIDHNMLIMEMLPKIAERFDLICLLHEKPYAGVNGSGKHNNWSITGPDGENWLSPGKNPGENAKFLTIICALMRGIDLHADLLRLMVASAGNDRRLGAREAPPPILSICLGEYLQRIIEDLGNDTEENSHEHRLLEVGVTALPPLPRDMTDRNRTSPFAFTGNKFEFRALGANQGCSGANMVLNTIVAEAIDFICSDVERDMAKGREFHLALQDVLTGIVKKHKRILYQEDNYSEIWEREAQQRGLHNLKTTLDVVEKVREEGEKIVALFEKYHVLKGAEWEARCAIVEEQYVKMTLIEANCSLTIAKKMVIPAALGYQRDLAQTIGQVRGCHCDFEETRDVLAQVSCLVEQTLQYLRQLEQCVESKHIPKILSAMDRLRGAVDSLESLVPSEKWPLPSYAEMMFKM